MSCYRLFDWRSVSLTLFDKNTSQSSLSPSVLRFDRPHRVRHTWPAVWSDAYKHASVGAIKTACSRLMFAENLYCLFSERNDSRRSFCTERILHSAGEPEVSRDLKPVRRNFRDVCWKGAVEHFLFSLWKHLVFEYFALYEHKNVLDMNAENY